MAEKGPVTLKSPCPATGNICRSHSNPREGKGRGTGAGDTIRVFDLAGVHKSSSSLTPDLTEEGTEAWRNEGACLRVKARPLGRDRAEPRSTSTIHPPHHPTPQAGAAQRAPVVPGPP